MNWLDSVYSDGTLGFVSNMTPEIGEKVRISMRVMEDSQIQKVFVRRISNGAEQYIEMEKDSETQALTVK